LRITILRFMYVLARRIRNFENKPASATSPIETTSDVPVHPTTSSATLPRFAISRFVHMLCHQPKSIEMDPSLEDAQIEKSPEPENIDDAALWKTRIVLSAFKCWFEEFELSAPPFPYARRWDPACKSMRRSSGREKGKGAGSRRNRKIKGRRKVREGSQGEA
jgi:hypothetical protein